MKSNKFLNYENGLLTTLSITFGLVFVDRFALIYLSPFIAKDLSLDNTQIGILASALSLTWAFSGYFSTAWAEANNKKKVVFIASTVLFRCVLFHRVWRRALRLYCWRVYLWGFLRDRLYR